MTMAGTRHKARTLALQALYEADCGDRAAGPVMARYLAEADLSEANQAFARELVDGTSRHRDEIDGHIRRYAPAWPVDQIAVIDRNILRLAIFEILFDNKVPVKAAVSEAVELAKRFGSDKSAKFVNGVLGAVITLASR
jgi:N utilization substance protein B